ncbi:hypothetical protein AQUCO_00900721v1 [Aquilegia coerulea]|uniref:Late embryogenesis abundant protein LEA-2 subgroup domain-containing protein n=1 Tax=Aquilegia coerulea TaxID=218851 RepID=A0A2G5EF43_AQUCA|nr:hypothetical protein AQUCO_00900721v1 [Aquilegia coerulea]
MDSLRNGFRRFTRTTRTTYEEEETIGIPVHQLPYQPYNPPPPPPPPRSTLRVRICVCTVSVIVVLALISGLIMLIIQPQLPEFQVDSISIPLLNSSSTSDILPTWEIGFHVRNPNKKMKIYYDVLETSLSYDEDYSEELLCETELSPFSQGTKNDTILWARFSYVQESSVTYITEKINHGVVSLKVKMYGSYKGKPDPYLVKKNMNINCIDLKVGFTNSTRLVGSLLDGSKRCKVTSN